MASKCEIYLAAQSLFFNTTPDLGAGHTATVATNIIQKGTISSKISAILDYDFYFKDSDYPDFSRELTKKARTSCEIKRIFIFKNISVNGSPIKNNAYFCMFIKEETDHSKAQFGRISLHYPLTLKNEALNINNQEVFEKVKNKLKGYAAKVISMNLSGDSLNFNCMIYGPKSSPLSLTLSSKENNFLWAQLQMPYYLRHYYLEKTALQKIEGGPIGLQELASSSISAFQEAKAKAIEEISKSGKDITDVSSLNPLCPYDLFYRDSEGRPHYCVIKFSYSSQIISVLSDEQKIFMLSFPKSSSIYFYQSWKTKNTEKHLFIDDFLTLCN